MTQTVNESLSQRQGCMCEKQQQISMFPATILDLITGQLKCSKNLTPDHDAMTAKT